MSTQLAPGIWTTDAKVIKRPGGRPPGTGTGPRPGSRSWQIAQMAVGDRLPFIVPVGRTPATYMGQIGGDIIRSGMRGRVCQTHGLLVEVGSRTAMDVVIVTRQS